MSRERTRRAAHARPACAGAITSAHGGALPCQSAPGLGTSSTASRCQDRPDRASWPRPAPLEQPRRLGRVAARARPAQRRLPSSRRRRSGGTVGQHGCRLTPGRAQRCWRVGCGLTRVRRLGPAGERPAPSTSSRRRVARQARALRGAGAGRPAYAAANRAPQRPSPRRSPSGTKNPRSAAWTAERLAGCARCDPKIAQLAAAAGGKVVSPCSEKVMATPRLPAAVAAAASTSLRWADRRVELVLLLAAQRMHALGAVTGRPGPRPLRPGPPLGAPFCVEQGGNDSTRSS